MDGSIRRQMQPSSHLSLIAVAVSLLIYFTAVINCSPVTKDSDSNPRPPTVDLFVAPTLGFRLKRSLPGLGKEKCHFSRGMPSRVLSSLNNFTSRCKQLQSATSLKYSTFINGLHYSKPGLFSYSAPLKFLNEF